MTIIGLIHAHPILTFLLALIIGDTMVRIFRAIFNSNNDGDEDDKCADYGCSHCYPSEYEKDNSLIADECKCKRDKTR